MEFFFHFMMKEDRDLGDSLVNRRYLDAVMRCMVSGLPIPDD